MISPMKRPAWTRRAWWLPVIGGAQRRYRDRPYWLTFSWWKTWWTAPDLAAPAEDPDHNATLLWALDYSPSRPDDADIYASALKYAERQYDQSIKLAETIDKKLDDLLRIAATLGTIIATAARFLPEVGRLARSPLLILALAALACAAIVSALSRGPTLMAFPMQARILLEIAERVPPATGITDDRVPLIELRPFPMKAQTDGIAAASYDYATAGTTRANIWKSRQMRRATVLLIIGMTSLLLMLIGNAVNPSSGPGQTPTPAAAAGSPKS
jgi:hypothetical protein